MPFKNACFISYRHRPAQWYQETIGELFRMISDEVTVYSSTQSVYLDEERLKGGAFFNSALARALCESVCMIAVYIPPYLDREASYCAREYRAMEAIEKQRLKLFPPGPARENGLIIPIIYRDWDHCPEEIRGRRHCYNFEQYTLSNKKLARQAGAVKAVREIAKYVNERSKMFNRLGIDPCSACSSFKFPTEASVRPWLQKVAQGTTFPR